MLLQQGFSWCPGDHLVCGSQEQDLNERNRGSGPLRPLSSPSHSPSSSSQQQWEVCEKRVTQQNFDASGRIWSFVCIRNVQPNPPHHLSCCLHDAFPAGTSKEKVATSLKTLFPSVSLFGKSVEWLGSFFRTNQLNACWSGYLKYTFIVVERS